MFGPNAVAGYNERGGSLLRFHHREQEYRTLLHDVIRLMRARFSIGDDFAVIPVTGSGTLANEMVLSSLRDGRHIFFHSHAGEFRNRLRALHAAHRMQWSALSGGPRVYHWAMVTYETAEGRWCSPQWGERTALEHPHVSTGFAVAGVRFADCISSFPYYDVPQDTDVWTTVSSKQLGALPTMSMVAVRNSCWEQFKGADEAYSYLNLARYYEAYANNGESPHTPSIALLLDLRERLERFDVDEARARIDARRKLLLSVLPWQSVQGEGPVLWVADEVIPAFLARSWSLYAPKRGGYEFFLYSGEDTDYEQFAEEFYKTWR